VTTPGLDSINLTYIEVAALECLEFMGDLSFDQFLNDRKTRAAIVWQICVIGEAANRLSENIRQQTSEIDWRRMIDMRNILIHGFNRIDYTIVWHAAQEELPPLVDSIKRLLEDLTAEGR
jgi:uncharacterized protein with HEPN domain